jgi:predicted metal-dependent hydrolase
MYTSAPFKQDWSNSKDLPKYYFGGSPFKTHFLHALSSVFPHGERFFIDSIKNYKDKITDPVLKEQVNTFIKQESWHTHAHQQYNNWLRSQGFPIDSVLKRANAGMERLKRTQTKLVWLETTVAIEHLTAITSAYHLRNEQRMKSVDPQLREMWEWHMIEEIEHKAVAMDVLNTVGKIKDLKIRRVIYFNATVGSFRNWMQHTIILLKADNQLWKWRTLKDMIVYFFGPRHGLLTNIFIPWLKGFKKDFHPNDIDDTRLLEKYYASNAIKSVQTP